MDKVRSKQELKDKLARLKENGDKLEELEKIKRDIAQEQERIKNLKPKGLIKKLFDRVR